MDKASSKGLFDPNLIQFDDWRVQLSLPSLISYLGPSFLGGCPKYDINGSSRKVRLFCGCNLPWLRDPIDYIGVTNLDQGSAVDDTLVCIGRIMIFFDSMR